MRTSRALIIALPWVLASALAACADQEPEFGLPSAIKGKSPISGTGGSSTSSGGTEGGAIAGAKDFFINTVEPAARTDCGLSCHRPTPGPELFGANPAATYDIFIRLNFHTAPNFRDKAAHSGPAISDALKAKVQQWQDAEQRERGGASSGGTTPPTDAGGG